MNQLVTWFNGREHPMIRATKKQFERFMATMPPSVTFRVTITDWKSNTWWTEEYYRIDSNQLAIRVSRLGLKCFVEIAANKP
jgi:hypothetical protein